MRKFLFLFLLVGLPLYTQTEADEIMLGSSLRLGMTQEQVLKDIAKHYTYKALSEPGQFVVFTQPKAEGEKPRWEGMLAFKAGKLTSVERLWAYENDDNSVVLAKSLISVLGSFVKGGHNTCAIQSLVSDAPDAQGQTIFVNCGKRSLKISVAKVEGYKEDASVSETLEQ